MALAGRAELRCEAPVRAETYEPGSLFPLMPTQNLLHRAFKVVIAQNTKDSTKMGKCQFVRFQKRLLRGVRIGPMKGATGGHRAHTELIRLAGLAIELSPALVPIYLRFAAKLIGLRHKDLMPGKAHGDLALSDIGAHRRLCDIDQRQLPAQTHPNPMGRVALLARCPAISFQDLVDERDRRRQLRPLSFWNFSFRWNCA